MRHGQGEVNVGAQLVTLQLPHRPDFLQLLDLGRDGGHLIGQVCIGQVCHTTPFVAHDRSGPRRWSQSEGRGIALIDRG